jgi:squalene synthase HpnC
MSNVGHYENFPVASVLCPPHLRAPIMAIYHFARTADDIADEGDASPAARLQQLTAFKIAFLNHLDHQSHAGGPWSQILRNLQKQITAFDLPIELLMALLSAFEQDVVYTRDQRRYANRAELLDYCTRSANPIGRLLMHLYDIRSETALAQSDAICTALQLINFWQDLSVDTPRARLYLPLNTDLTSEIAFARQLMVQGAALVHQVPGRAGWELRLVVQGGLRILDKIESTDTRLHRPRLRAMDIVTMLWRSIWMRSGQ